MKQRFFSTALRLTALILVSALVGFGLLAAVYALPTAPMLDNAAEAARAFETEKTYHQMVENYTGTRLDNFTDSLMLLEALHPSQGRSIWQQAAKNYHYADPDVIYLNVALQEYCETGAAGLEECEYSRYWHGFLVLLKPLLLLFGHSTLRVLNGFLQLSVMALTCWLLGRRHLDGLLLPYLLAMLSLFPAAVGFCFQYSSVFYIFSAALLVILWQDHALRQKGLYPFLFALAGIATAYLDLLTYPLAAWGLPLVLALALGADDTLRAQLSRAFGWSVCWGYGFGGMWALKWVLSSLVTGENLLAGALNQTLARTSADSGTGLSGSAVRWQALLRNLDPYDHKALFLVLGLLLFAVLVVAVRRRAFAQLPARLPSVLPFLLIAPAPFVWFLLLGNHSYIHNWFTFRSLSVTVFALACAVSLLVRKLPEREPILAAAQKNA